MNAGVVIICIGMMLICVYFALVCAIEFAKDEILKAIKEKKK